MLSSFRIPLKKYNCLILFSLVVFFDPLLCLYFLVHKFMQGSIWVYVNQLWGTGLGSEKPVSGYNVSTLG